MHVIKKQLFQIRKSIVFWNESWSFFTKNADKFEMLPLVIFSIIPKLP